MKKIYFSLIMISILALLTVGMVEAREAPTNEQVHKVIKLTTKNLPIHKYFVDEDEDEELYTANHAMLFRRETAIKARVDIAPTEDDVVITDGIRLRLWLARMKALEAYQKIHGTA